ncbi:MAG: Peptidoglycan-binding lysin domain protein [Myxococcales bacterium]|nr:Peptidoglycan-binding lysin domain protein [Myxococcales bacterium]
MHPDLLIVFPVLADANQLAAVMSPTIIKLLLSNSDPNQVAGLLSREPVIAKAEKLLASHPELLDRLPRYRHMTKAGKEGVDRLAKPAKGQAADILHDIRENDWEPRESVRQEGGKFHAAAKRPTLAAGLEALFEDRGSATSALALIGEHRDQIPALLSDAANEETVTKLAALVQLPAHVVFPQLPIESLLGMANSRSWLFDYPDAYILLDLVATRGKALHLVAQQINHGDGRPLTWMHRLPVGPALTDVEGLALDRLQPLLTDARILRLLFKVRFGIDTPGTYDIGTVRELYRVVCRLPRAHLQQERIKAIVEGPADAGPAGTWNGEQVEIKESIRPGENDEDRDTFHPDSAIRYTRAQLQRLYGWSDLELQIHVKQGRVKQLVAPDQYQLVEQKISKFTSVVLHEIGHSVDDILGRHTQPVYGFAKWHSYSEGDVAAWAAEMGGWDSVTAADQKQISQAWLDALRSGSGVHDRVGKEHPALADRYEHVGIVSAARQQKKFGHDDPVRFGDRAFIMQPYYGMFYSVAASAVDSRPSVYSLYAPAEYFAESYVEYYREVDGTPGSRGKKGGTLPTPVKDWFTNHVDQLRFDPKRLEGPAEEAGDPSPAPVDAAAKQA